MLPLAAAALAGCGSGGHEATSTTARPPRAPMSAQPKPRPDAARPTRPRLRLRKVQVTVVDGNTLARIRGARVTIGGRSALTDRNGVAHVPLRRHSALMTAVARNGYIRKAVRLYFHAHPKSSVRLYRPGLQWTMYGATPQRTQAQTAIHVRPPFRVIWSRGIGSLIEFPAVVSEGVAYIGSFRGSVEALDMSTGHVVWRRDLPARKMAASPAVWGDRLVVHDMDGHVWLLRRGDGRPLWRFDAGSSIESSPVVRDGIDYFGTWNGVMYALDLQSRRVVWRRYDGCKITSSASLCTLSGRMLRPNPTAARCPGEGSSGRS